MSSYSEDGDDPRPKRLIYEMRERVQQARNRYFREGTYGEATERTHLELAEVVVEYYDVLYEFRDESIVGDDFPDIGDIEERIGEKTVVYEEAPGDTTNVQPVQRPAVLELDTRRLVEATKQLDDLAKQLGFAASAADRPSESQFSEDDLLTLLETRGQEDSIGEAPADITDRVVEEDGDGE